VIEDAGADMLPFTNPRDEVVLLYEVAFDHGLKFANYRHFSEITIDCPIIPLGCDARFGRQDIYRLLARELYGGGQVDVYGQVDV